MIFLLLMREAGSSPARAERARFAGCDWRAAIHARKLIGRFAVDFDCDGRIDLCKCGADFVLQRCARSLRGTLALPGNGSSARDNRLVEQNAIAAASSTAASANLGRCVVEA